MATRETYTSQLNDPVLTPVTSDTFTGPQDLLAGTHALPAQPCSIGVNYLKNGTSIWTRASGTFSTTATPTLVLGVYYGTIALAVNVAITTASGAVTLPWILDTVTTIYNTVPGTAVVTRTRGTLRYGLTATTMTEVWVPGTAPANVTVDNTASQPWTVKATFGTSSASNIVVLDEFNAIEFTHI